MWESNNNNLGATSTAFDVETDPATEGTTELNLSDTALANKPKKIIKNEVQMGLLMTVMLWMYSLMQLCSITQIRNAEAAVLSAPGYAAIRESSVLLYLLLVQLDPNVNLPNPM